MGVTEEGGKAVTSIVEALKSAPVLLAILIFNIIFLGLGAYQTIDARSKFTELLLEVIKDCGRTAVDRKTNSLIFDENYIRGKTVEEPAKKD